MYHSWTLISQSTCTPFIIFLSLPGFARQSFNHLLFTALFIRVGDSLSATEYLSVSRREDLSDTLPLILPLWKLSSRFFSTVFSSLLHDLARLSPASGRKPRCLRMAFRNLVSVGRHGESFAGSYHTTKCTKYKPRWVFSKENLIPNS